MSLCAPLSHHRALFTSEISLPFSGCSSSRERDNQLMSEGGVSPESGLSGGISELERCRVLTLSPHISLGGIWSSNFPMRHPKGHQRKSLKTAVKTTQQECLCLTSDCVHKHVDKHEKLWETETKSKRKKSSPRLPPYSSTEPATCRPKMEKPSKSLSFALLWECSCKSIAKISQEPQALGM